MKFHPACLMLPRQSEHEQEALRESIRAGWNPTHPVITFEGMILDGRHRYEICTELGVTPTFKEWDGTAFDGNPYRFVRVEHDARRNWQSQEQRHLVLSEILEKEGVFDADRHRIADEANAKRSEAAKGNQNAAKGEKKNSGTTNSGTTESSSPMKKKRSGHQKAEKAKAAKTGTNRGAVQRSDKMKRLAEELNRPDIIKAVKAGETKAHAALKNLEEMKRAKDLARPVEMELPEGIHRGDFRELAAMIPDNSVELVFTDPPYDEKSVGLYADAARVAARILKPGGSMIAYSGQKHLPAVLSGMSAHLRYWWTCAGIHEGGNQILEKLGIRCGWKPLVWFVKGGRGDVQNILVDTVRGDREKDAHEWQQAASEARYFIEKLCPAGGLVVDFFLGGGTTKIAADQLERRFIGFEVNAKALEGAAKRIAQGAA